MENTVKITTPRVHLNGTAKQTLYNQYDNAADAIYKALKAVEESAPNARDYYVIDDQAFSRARKEHDERQSKLTTVLAEMYALLEALAS